MRQAIAAEKERWARMHSQWTRYTQELGAIQYAQRCRFNHTDRESLPNVTKMHGSCPHYGLIYRGSHAIFWEHVGRG